MINNEEIEKINEELLQDKNNKIMHRILNKVSLNDLITDQDTVLKNDFNININTHKVTDQKKSGRCWAFAGLNLIREQIIEKCNIDNIVLSGSYIAFYDKLEKTNYIFERIIRLIKEGQKVYSEKMERLLNNGLGDGGYFYQFVDLIDKYGIVPENNFSENYPSSNTVDLNFIISRLIRKFYLAVEKNLKESKKIKKEYLEKLYKLLVTFYGIPPKTFSFEYTDKKGNYHIEPNLTPKEFYNKYVGKDFLKDCIEISSYEDEKIKYNNYYELEDNKRMYEKDFYKILNLPEKAVIRLVIKQLKNKEPVYLCSITSNNIINGLWNDLARSYGELLNVDITMNRNEILKTNSVPGAHAMLLTGVNVVNGQTTRWKLENSWGPNNGIQGYWQATNEYMKNYVYRVVIRKKYLTKKQQDLLSQKPIILKQEEQKF